MRKIILPNDPDFAFDAMIEPTATATWVQFVKKGEEHSRHFLDEEIESFLVFTLMRFEQRTDLLALTLALEYLKASTEYTGQRKEQALTDVGDTSLIFAGLFPERSHRLNVPASYFSQMGRMAFTDLANLFALKKLRGLEGLYRNAEKSFSVMTEVLLSARENKYGNNFIENLAKKKGFLTL